MLFLTYWFVLFVSIFLAAYWVIPYPRMRLVLLLAACVIFHTHFAGPAGVLPIIVLGVLTYAAGLSRNKSICLLGIVLCVWSLVFYKYTHFLCWDVLARVWYHGAGEVYRLSSPLLPERPPLAISFFAFEFIHYLYDVRGGSEPIRSPLDFSLFALFWPSIVAGPVKRYQQFVPELHEGVRSVSSRDVAIGMFLVAVGLVKKFAADNLTAYVHHQPLFSGLCLGDRWLVFAALGARILLDFSGYSDMALGFARMVGVRLPANFNWPYLATNLVDFWRRWHISLSEWIRDYVYIPIGGSRHGMLRKICNGLIAFGLCGLWHGAAWNFLAWGLYHGVGLALCSGCRRVVGQCGEVSAGGAALRRIVGWAATLLFVHVGWLLFFYPLPQAWDMFLMLLGAR
jgi:alginate O-acetyltransferase complex protein AlgI